MLNVEKLAEILWIGFSWPAQHETKWKVKRNLKEVEKFRNIGMESLAVQDLALSTVPDFN